MQAEAKDRGVAVSFSGAGATLRGLSFGADTSEATVILVPDVHGVSPLYCEIAARFAAAGLRILLLDLYVREGTPRLTDMAAVQAWIADLPDARVLGDIGDAVAHLRSDAGGNARRVGIVGFCLGGQYALMAASRLDGLDACVAFYGMLRHGRTTARKLPPPAETADALRCPVLGLFGADDALIPASDREVFRSGAERSGQPLDLRVFSGAGHAFVNDRRRDAYRADAAREALDLAVTFLHDRLMPPSVH
ncbi:dienelactone hydrolase family protein [Candidatus Binatia bacterium]|nr:dienelactone hydrolase family protein [Candidatus Binatia bacterium]